PARRLRPSACGTGLSRACSARRTAARPPARPGAVVRPLVLEDVHVPGTAELARAVRSTTSAGTPPGTGGLGPQVAGPVRLLHASALPCDLVHEARQAYARGVPSVPRCRSCSIVPPGRTGVLQQRHRCPVAEPCARCKTGRTLLLEEVSMFDQDAELAAVTRHVRRDPLTVTVLLRRDLR